MLTASNTIVSDNPIKHLVQKVKVEIQGMSFLENRQALVAEQALL